MDLSVFQILGSTSTTLVAGSRDTLVSGYSIDTRTCVPGDMFVCFAGEKVDGNDYVPQALEAGASAVVMTREPSSSEVALAEQHGAALLFQRDGDAERFLSSLASYVREQHPTWVVVGLTGSVGKTTTKEILTSALGVSRRVHATEGNLNSLIGVSLTILRAPEDALVLVLEMGMNHAGELFRQSLTARPNLAVITNVGTSHIGNLGSREGIARAKAEILEGLQPNPFVAGGGYRLFMPHEDDFSELIATRQAGHFGIDTTFAGLAEGNDIRATNLVTTDDGTVSFEVLYPDGAALPVHLSIPGTHVVSDAVLALAVADCMGVAREEAASAVAATRPYKMRLEVLTAEGKPRILDDSYNANPASMSAAVDVLCSMACEGRRIAVLGEMGELGAEAASLHALVGAYAAAKNLDMLVIIGGDMADKMAEGARICGMSSDHIERFSSVSEAASTLKPLLAADDLVLVKASRSAGLDVFAREVLA